jgi:sugar lactone lactonase YvrE
MFPTCPLPRPNDVAIMCIVRLASIAFAILASIIIIAFPAYSEANLDSIEVPGDRAYPESISAAPDGTLYVSSLASGGIARIKPGASKAEPWIKPGAFDSRSTFGVLVDERSNLLWVCSNDMSGVGVPGPSSIPGSFLKGFDLATGEGKVSAALPGSHNLCNDMTIAVDGSLYVTNSRDPQILRLKADRKELEVWLEDKQFDPPKDGVGLDGIAIGGDGNIYVNTFTKGEFFRVEIREGRLGNVTRLKTSRPLTLPDGLRPLSDRAFLMAEGGGTLDRVSIAGDNVTIETLRDGLAEPTAVAKVGETAWVAEGQLSHLFNPAANGPPRLPFRITGIPVGP